MLTPGIEYFPARADEEAVSFGEGRLSYAVPLVRADGIAPDGIFAIVGSLLAGMTMEAVSDPTRLVELAVEHRPEGTVTVVRLPLEVSAALRSTTPDLLVSIGERLRGYLSLSEAEGAAATRFLAFLAEMVRDGSDLYARMISVEQPRRRWRPTRQQLVTLFLAAAVVVVLGIILIYTVPALQGANALVFVISAFLIGGIFALPVFETVKDSRTARTVERIRSSNRGSVVLTVAVTKAFRQSLAETLGQVVDGEVVPAVMGKVREAFLVVDPSGAELHLGRSPSIRIPRAAITDAQIDYTPAKLGSFGIPLLIAALSFTLRTSTGKEIQWVVPLMFGGTALNATAAAHILVLVRSGLGL